MISVVGVFIFNISASCWGWSLTDVDADGGPAVCFADLLNGDAPVRAMLWRPRRNDLHRLRRAKSGSTDGIRY